MEKLVVAAIAEWHGREVTAAEVRRDAFRPDILDEVLPTLLRATRSHFSVSTDEELAPFKVEVAVRLSSDQATRPSLHIGRKALATLARANASLDFDPYC